MVKMYLNFIHRNFISIHKTVYVTNPDHLQLLIETLFLAVKCIVKKQCVYMFISVLHATKQAVHSL